MIRATFFKALLDETGDPVLLPTNLRLIVVRKNATAIFVHGGGGRGGRGGRRGGGGAEGGGGGGRGGGGGGGGGTIYIYIYVSVYLSTAQRIYPAPRSRQQKTLKPESYSNHSWPAWIL